MRRQKLLSRLNCPTSQELASLLLNASDEAWQLACPVASRRHALAAAEVASQACVVLKKQVQATLADRRGSPSLGPRSRGRSFSFPIYLPSRPTVPTLEETKERGSRLLGACASVVLIAEFFALLVLQNGHNDAVLEAVRPLMVPDRGGSSPPASSFSRAPGSRTDG